MAEQKERKIKLEDDLINEIIAICKPRRLELGLTQEALSYLMTGKIKNHSYVNKLENGIYTGLTVNSMSKLLKALKVDVHFTYKEI